MKEEKASDFLERNSVEDKDGVKKIHVGNSLIELYARIKSMQLKLNELESAVGYFTTLEDRINTLEGNKKIQVVSEGDAKNILKG